MTEVVEVSRRCRLLENEGFRTPGAGLGSRLESGFCIVVPAPGVAGAVQPLGDPAVRDGPYSRREDAEAALRGLPGSDDALCRARTIRPIEACTGDRDSLWHAGKIRT